MELKIKMFKELTTEELHDIFQLRSEVFVVEQDCVYQDIDGKDKEALHIIGRTKGRLVAYTRCFAPGFYFKEASIGRVVVAYKERKNKYGDEIMKVSIQAIQTHYQTQQISLSAQSHLKNFYKNHGFSQVGEGYLEDGIPHIMMVNTIK
jgi:ElaA protein